MNKIKAFLLEALYPEKCIICGRICRGGLCTTCREKLLYVEEPRCKKCGKPIRRQEAEYCYDCANRPKTYEQGRSVWLHRQPISGAIYRFKYKKKQIYGACFAREMYDRYGDWMRQNRIEVLIPIPLHKSRRRMRGYNQAEVLARNLSELSGIPMDSHGVLRKRKTVAQKVLNDRQRRTNLARAFAIREGWKPKKRVLLIDDIYTTGSTIEGVSSLLLQAGVEKVWFLTISIGQGFE